MPALAITLTSQVLSAPKIQSSGTVAFNPQVAVNLCPYGESVVGYYQGQPVCYSNCPSGYHLTGTATFSGGTRNTVTGFYTPVSVSGLSCVDQYGCTTSETPRPSPCSPSSVTACFPKTSSTLCPAGEEYDCSDPSKWQRPQCVACPDGFHYVGINSYGTGGTCIDQYGRNLTQAQESEAASTPTAFCPEGDACYFNLMPLYDQRNPNLRFITEPASTYANEKAANGGNDFPSQSFLPYWTDDGKNTSNGLCAPTSQSMVVMAAYNHRGPYTEVSGWTSQSFIGSPDVAITDLGGSFSFPGTLDSDPFVPNASDKMQPWDLERVALMALKQGTIIPFGGQMTYFQNTAQDFSDYKTGEVGHSVLDESGFDSFTNSCSQNAITDDTFIGLVRSKYVPIYAWHPYSRRDQSFFGGSVTYVDFGFWGWKTTDQNGNTQYVWAYPNSSNATPPAGSGVSGAPQFYNMTNGGHIMAINGYFKLKVPNWPQSQGLLVYDPWMGVRAWRHIDTISPGTITSGVPNTVMIMTPTGGPEGYIRTPASGDYLDPTALMNAESHPQTDYQKLPQSGSVINFVDDWGGLYAP